MNFKDRVRDRNLSPEYLSCFEELIDPIDDMIDAAAMAYDLAVDRNEVHGYLKESENLGADSLVAEQFSYPHDVLEEEFVSAYESIRDDKLKPVDPHKHVPSLSNKLEQSLEVNSLAHSILTRSIKKDPSLVARNEQGLAGAAVYLSGLHSGKSQDYINQREVNDRVDACSETVSNAIRKINSVEN